MKTLFDLEARNEVLLRIEKLSPDSVRQWGLMDPAQMLAHCEKTLEMALGLINPPRVFIGRIIGPFLHSVYTSDTPLKKNTPTEKMIQVTEPKDFEQEKERVIKMIKQFGEGGEAKATKHAHPFFGKLSAEAWGKGMYKHFDHHLRQFGA
jgi:hypothetical protein